MKKKEFEFNQSIKEIESIIEKIEKNETDLNDLPAEVKRATCLLQQCREKLFHVDQEVKKIIVE